MAGPGRTIPFFTAEQGPEIGVEMTTFGQREVALAWGRKLSLYPRGPWTLRPLSAPASHTWAIRHHCGRKILASKDDYVLVCRTCEHVTLPGNKDSAGTFSSGFLRDDIILGYLDGPNAIITRILIRGRRIRVREQCGEGSRDGRDVTRSQGMPQTGSWKKFAPGASRRKQSPNALVLAP